MSEFYPLPVSGGMAGDDLEQLQLGIQFYTNDAQAFAEAGAINSLSTTVTLYATQLLASNISLSQVAMGVDALMFNETDTVAELTKLSTVFLPPQVALAIKDGYQPTVYAAQALGLALSGSSGDGGTGNSFASQYGALSTSAFATTVATATGINATAIQGWVTYWLGFYTANPSAIPSGSSVTLAAYGAALGDAVGEALLLFPSDGTPGGIVSAEIQNALYDNAQGSYVAGVPIGSLPTALTFQGGVFPTFTLTLNQDTVVSGQPFDGTGPVVPGSNVVVNAPLVTGTIFGTTAPFATLTSGDDINLSGTNNELVANLGAFTFGFTQTISGLTISGVQAWDITNSNTIWNSQLSNLWGAGLTAPDILNYHDALGSLQIGSGAQPVGMDAQGDMLTNINVTNDAFVGGYQYLAISMKASDFTGSNAITVNANGVGNGTPGHHSDWSNFGIIAGPTTGTVGYLDWTVNSSGGVSNNIALGAESATNAVSLTINDDDATGTTTYLRASWTDGSGPGNWANLTTIDATGTSDQLTVTGGEHSYGLLASNTTAITTVYGGSGPDVFDLSASTWGSVSGVTINGNNATNTPVTTGANTLADSNWATGYAAASGQGTGTVVELSSTEIGTISAVASAAFASWSNVPDLYDVGATVSGTINMADFPGTDIVTIANAHSGNYTAAGDIAVTNAPNNFIFNFQDVQSAGNFSIMGVGGVADTATVNYGTGYLSTDPVGGTGGSAVTFSTQGIDNVTVNVWGATGLGAIESNVYNAGIVAVANNTGSEVLTIDSNVGLGLAYHGTAILSDTTLALFGGTESTTTLPPFITTWSATGTLDLTGSGDIWLGVTNATTIDESGGGVLNMMAPDDCIDYGTGTGSAAITGDVVMSNGAGSILQGSMDGVNFFGIITLTATTGDDSLTGISSAFYGDGAADSMWLSQDSSNDANNVYFGTYYLNGASDTLIIEGRLGPGVGLGAPGFWGNDNAGVPVSIITLATSPAGNGFTSDATGTDGTSFDMTTINGFTLGTLSDDILNFNHLSWFGSGSGNGGYNHLVDGALATVGAAGAATGVIVNSTGQPLVAGENLMIYNTLGNVANAAALAADLGSTLGQIDFANSGNSGHQYHMLVAYSTGTSINIADVDFISNGNLNLGTAIGTGTTAIYASDMVSLAGQSNLLTFAAHVHDVVFV